VLIAFLVGNAAAEKGHEVAMFLTKEAVRLALPDVAVGVACEGCPPLERLVQQFADNRGELLVCPICFNSKRLDESQLVGNARLAGATPLWEWIGDEPATVFSY
jgi:predicted peroxiredoxin